MFVRVRLGSGHRRDGQDALSGQCHRLPAGEQEHQPRGVTQEDVHEDGHRVHQMFAGVQYQQCLLVREMTEKLVHRLGRSDLGQTDRGGHRVGQELGVPQTAQFDDADAVREVDRRLVRGPHRDPALADPTGAGERDQPGLRHRAPHGLQLGRTADEPGGLVPRSRPGPCPLRHAIPLLCQHENPTPRATVCLTFRIRRCARAESPAPSHRTVRLRAFNDRASRRVRLRIPRKRPLGDAYVHLRMASAYVIALPHLPILPTSPRPEVTCGGRVVPAPDEGGRRELLPSRHRMRPLVWKRIDVSNLATALVDMAQRQPQGLAMQDEKTVLTYADLDDLSARAAGGLRAHGVRPGGRVGLNCPVPWPSRCSTSEPCAPEQSPYPCTPEPGHPPWTPAMRPVAHDSSSPLPTKRPRGR